MVMCHFSRGGSHRANPGSHLHDALAHGGQQALVHVRGQRVVQQDVGPLPGRPEGPHGARGQHVPVVLGGEELAQAAARPGDVDRAALDVLRQALPRGFSGEEAQ